MTTPLRKMASYIQFTNEQLGIFEEPTTEDRARWAARAAADQARIDGAATYAAGVRNPILRAVLELHKPETNYPGNADCLGCDFGGYESEPPDWPCRTVTTIYEGLSTLLS